MEKIIIDADLTEKSFVFTMPSFLYNQLRKFAFANEVSMGTVCRESINKFLEANHDKTKSG